MVANGNDTIVRDHAVVLDESGVAKVSFASGMSGVAAIDVDGRRIPESGSVEISDYLSRMQGPVKVSTADIVARSSDGSLSLLEDAANYEISDVAKCRYVSKTVLNAASPEYNEAGNWLGGLLYAVQALGSVAWAVVLPRFKSRKFSYTLSLLLGAAGFHNDRIDHQPVSALRGIHPDRMRVGRNACMALYYPYKLAERRQHRSIPRTFQLHDMRAADCRRSCRRMDSVDAQRAR